MFGIINFEAFVIAGILLNLTPGTDTFYILSQSMANGKKAGFLSALGISTGSIIHTVFATLGLSFILAESQLAFDILKYAGAIYLIYLGIKAMFITDQNSLPNQKNVENQRNSKNYVSGILTNVLNPKVALFYLAFLPQFVDPVYSNHFISLIILGLTFTTTGTIWCLILAKYSAKLTEKIKENPCIKIWLDRLTGIIFISLGVKLALSKLK